ncbi:MAG: metal ABC transporter substrate-binding protein [Gammaproteobacteria bacterium]
MIFRFHLLVVCLMAALSAACSENSSTENVANTNEATIVTLNYPLFYFTEKLTNGLARVILPLPADIDPAQWNPGLDDILQMQKARLIILNGAGYSTWLDKVSLSPDRLVNSSLKSKEQWISLQGETTHSHGPQGEHSHRGYAFTTWMDISLAKQQVSTIARALVRLWPDQQQKIAQRELKLLGDLTSLDESYEIQARRLDGTFLIYSHPVYQYFERRYQLSGHSLHWEAGEMPADEQWQSLDKLLTGKTKVLFVWEDKPSAMIADRMHGIGLEYVVIRPAANVGNLDWLSEQQSNLKRLHNVTDTP